MLGLAMVTAALTSDKHLNTLSFKFPSLFKLNLRKKYDNFLNGCISV